MFTILRITSGAAARPAFVGRARRRERGSSLLLAMIVLTALGLLSTLSVLGVRGGLQTSASNRFHAIALYAAESGAASATDYLRGVISTQTGWGALISPSNGTIQAPAAIVGNDKLFGDPENPFSSDVNAAYHVEILNDRSDTGYVAGLDNNKRVVIRATGYGPDGATAIIEWDVQAAGAQVRKPCEVYPQQGQAEDNSGVNDCLGTFDAAAGSVFTPGP